MIDNAKYLDSAALIIMMKRRIGELLHSDVWHAAEYWGVLEALHNLMLEMHKNNMINTAGKQILEMEIRLGTDPKKAIVEYNGENLTVYIVAQAISCRHFLQQASTMACLQ